MFSGTRDHFKKKRAGSRTSCRGKKLDFFFLLVSLSIKQVSYSLLMMFPNESALVLAVRRRVLEFFQKFSTFLNFRDKSYS